MTPVTGPRDDAWLRALGAQDELVEYAIARGERRTPSDPLEDLSEPCYDAPDSPGLATPDVGAPTGGGDLSPAALAPRSKGE